MSVPGDRSVDEVRRLIAGRAPVVSPTLRVVHAHVGGRLVRFCSSMQRDPIQRHHRAGAFYEAEELAALTPLFPRGGTFVDIGANIGNHTLYAALFLGAGRVIPFEPNPLAWELLVTNVLLNDLTGVVALDRLGVGLADRAQGGFAMEARDRNLGGARMLAEGGSLRVERGDAMLADETPDLIKIDVEGMEMAVLSGLDGLLDRCAPVLMVEVDNDNAEGFGAWVARRGYVTLHTHARYAANRNHIIVPEARAEALRAVFVPPALQEA